MMHGKLVDAWLSSMMLGWLWWCIIDFDDAWMTLMMHGWLWWNMVYSDKTWFTLMMHGWLWWCRVDFDHMVDKSWMNYIRLVHLNRPLFRRVIGLFDRYIRPWLQEYEFSFYIQFQCYTCKYEMIVSYSQESYFNIVVIIDKRRVKRWS